MGGRGRRRAKVNHGRPGIDATAGDPPDRGLATRLSKPTVETARRVADDDGQSRYLIQAWAMAHPPVTARSWVLYRPTSAPGSQSPAHGRPTVGPVPAAAVLRSPKCTPGRVQSPPPPRR